MPRAGGDAEDTDHCPWEGTQAEISAELGTARGWGTAKAADAAELS